MLWTRALRTLFKNPLYLVMTLLPVMLVVLLLFPIFQSLTNTFDTIYEAISQAQFFEGSSYYYDPFDEAMSNEIINVLFSSLLPLLGSILVILVIELLTSLLLTPVSLQYLGDATRLGFVPVGFAGRGLKRLWWKPFIFSMIVSLGMNILSSMIMTPISSIASMVVLMEEVGPFLVTFGIAFFITLLVRLYLSMATHMFYGSIAMEERSFGSAMGRGFVRGFKRFGPLLGANILVSLISGIAIFAVIGFYVFNSMDTFTALENAQSYEEAMFYLDKLLNDLCILISLSAVISWFSNCFMTSYAFQQTQYQISREQALLAQQQSYYQQYAPYQQPQVPYQQPLQPEEPVQSADESNYIPVDENTFADYEQPAEDVAFESADKTVFEPVQEQYPTEYSPILSEDDTNTDTDQQ